MKAANVQQGFTIIELMIVVAILGVLASLAVPVYQDYTTRARVAEVFTATEPIKRAIEEYYHQNGRLGISTTDLGGDLPIPNGHAWATNIIRLVSAGTSAAGYRGGIFVELKYKDQGLPVSIADKTILLNPVISGGSIRWECPEVQINSSLPVPKKYLPRACLPET